jgi:hypothetical protein
MTTNPPAFLQKKNKIRLITNSTKIIQIRGVRLHFITSFFNHVSAVTKIATHVNAGFQLVDWNAAAVGQHLAADVFADGRGAVQLQQQVGLEQVLAPGDLAVGD